MQGPSSVMRQLTALSALRPPPSALPRAATGSFMSIELGSWKYFSRTASGPHRGWTYIETRSTSFGPVIKSGRGIIKAKSSRQLRFSLQHGCSRDLNLGRVFLLLAWYGYFIFVGGSAVLAHSTSMSAHRPISYLRTIPLLLSDQV